MDEESVVLEQPQDDVQPSMEDTIRETYKALQSSESDEAKAERLRDEKGRFAGKQEPEAEAAPEVAEPVEPVAPARKPPSSWRKEAQELYGKLPGEYSLLQEEIERREADFHKGIETYKGKAQFADAMERVIAPHAQTLQAMGVTPDVAVHHLLEADRVLRYSAPQQKLQYLHQLAKSYGIDLAQPGEAEYQPAQPTDGRVDAVINYLRQQEQQRQRQEMATLNSEIAKFSEGKEHFEQVRDYMAGLLQAGVATSLQDAYDQAIYANPTIRASVLAQQQAQQEKERQEAARKQAEAARKASSVNVPRRGFIPPQARTGSMDDTIRDTARKLGIL